MSAILWGNQPCLDPNEVLAFCRQSGLPVDWYGLPNSWTCPLGCESGTGWLLLSRASLDALGLDTPRDLVLRLDPKEVAGYPVTAAQSATHKNLYPVSARCLTPGLRGDPAATYLVELADRRRLARAVPINRGYNTHLALGSSSYYSATLNAGIAWTWAGVVEDLWNAVGVSRLGTFPGLPFVPAGTPEGLHFHAWYALDALGVVLDRLGCALKLDTQTDLFSIVRLAVDDPAASAALSAADNVRVLDDEPILPVRVRRPEKVRVFFPKTTAVLDATGGSPFYSVDVTDPSGTAAGVEVGTYAILHDTNEAVYDGAGALTNGAALATVASERAADFFRRCRQANLHRTFGLPLSVGGLRPGAQLRATRWGDRGRGLVTETGTMPMPGRSGPGCCEPSPGGIGDPLAPWSYAQGGGGWVEGGDPLDAAWRWSMWTVFTYIRYYLDLDSGSATGVWNGVTISVVGNSSFAISTGVILSFTGLGTVNFATAVTFSNTVEFTSTSSVVFNGPLEVCGELLWCYATIAINSSNNDLAQPVGAPKMVYRLTLTGDSTLSGVVPVGDLQVICLHNTSDTFFLTLQDEDAGSAAANRFHLPDGRDLEISPGGSAILWKDPVLARWVDLADTWQLLPGDPYQVLGVDSAGALAWQGDTQATQSANFTVTAADHRTLYPVDAGAATVTVTLPLGSTVADGFCVWFQRLDNSQVNYVNFSPSGGNVIDGGSSFTLNPLYASCALYWNGSSWTVRSLSIRGTTKGDLSVYDGHCWQRLAVGTNAQVLTADSTQTLGVKWATPSTGGGGSTMASGMAVCGTQLNLAANTWADVPGLSVTLPNIGTYTIHVDICANIEISAGAPFGFVQSRLDNGATITDSVRGCACAATNNVTYYGSGTISYRLTTTVINTVVKVQANAYATGTFTSAAVRADALWGRSAITYQQVS